MTEPLSFDTLPTTLQPQESQRRASDPDMSVWVGASAGSGKTKVLADRVLRLLLTGVAPQKILCLTFTRAAAAQMEIRITAQLSHWATCSDDILREELDALQNEPPEPEQINRARCLFAETLNCPGGMRIRTIHAFAQEILRRFPLEAGLPPQFALSDDAETKALHNESLMDLIQDASRDPASATGQALQALAQEIAETDLTELLHEAIAEPEKLEELLRQNGSLEKLAQKQRLALDLDPDTTEDSLLTEAVHRALAQKETLRQAAEILLQGTTRHAPHGQGILTWLSWPLQKQKENFNFYTRQFLTGTDTPYNPPLNKELAERFPDTVAFLDAEAARLLSIKERLEALRWIDKTRHILTLAFDLLRRYTDRKAAQSVLDYDDLIRYANNLLRRDDIAAWVLFKLDGGIDHILVDEAQDTSPAQWSIVAALADEFFHGQSAREQNRTLFVVGDEKQSIYSFLKADPTAFARMHEHFRAKIIAAKENSYATVPLHISFRSAPAILQAVDAVFSADETRQGVSSITVEHQAWRREAEGRVEVWPLIAPPKQETKKKDKKKKEETEDSVEQTTDTWTLPLANERDENPAAALAQKIADTISSWLRNGERVRDRTMEAGDIMILVRHRNIFVDHLVRALKERSIPVSGIDRMKLTEQLPVMDLVALLNFTLLPEDDLNLATVLRGPLLGATEEQLMTLAVGREGSLWDSLKNQGNAPVFSAFLAYLQKWMKRADQISPFAMLAEILQTSCPANIISGKRAIVSRLGFDALDPIDELLNAAQEFGLRHAPSLQSFLQWLTETEAEIKRELDQSGGQVRITTVHTAKGLEAPVVILPDTTTLPEKKKLAKIVWNAEALPFYIPRDPLNAKLKALRDHLWDKQMEEYRRLLYVALTRPADRLYVCGYENNRPDQSGQNWYALIRNALEPLHEPAAVRNDAVVAFCDPAQPRKKASLPPANDEAKAIALPLWAHTPAPEEPDPPRPLVPSRPTQSEPASATPLDVRFSRGRIIHRLLQSLPDIPATLRAEKTKLFLSNPQHGLSGKDQTAIAREVLNLLSHPDFSPLFSAQSRAEVPIVGRHGNTLISGQIDRLCVLEKEVWIVDYKTNRPPPLAPAAVPEVYHQQMAAYKTVVGQIYPDKIVRCFLLWTYAPLLMEIT